ncbi:response regulator, partial [Candidatus Marithioploca araucensis]|nr:response regulator [Candidatus Marithioploca araucensis]
MKAKSTILIVDDEEIGREALKGLLTNQGYDLFFANNGVEALALAAKLTPDVILLDVMMPEMDGFDVCHALRANSHLAEIPIIIVTALDDQDSRQLGIEAGADEFISKPFNCAELRARVRTITNLNRYRPLLTEQTKFKWVIEQANEGYLILEHNEQISYANPQARLYLNLHADDVITESFLDLAKKQYHCEPQAIWKKGLGYFEKQILRYLVRPETSISEAFWLQVDVMEMSRGTGEKYLVRLRNVTDTILAERRKWTFQGQIRHKLKTPLSPITMGLEYLQSNYADLSDKDRKEFIEIAYSGATRLHAEIEEIFKYLDVSDVLKPEFGICHITDILLIINTIKEDMALKSVHVLQKNIKSPDNISIFFSPQAMELVLTELFSNAKKFHPEGSPCLEINISAIPEGLCL